MAEGERTRPGATGEGEDGPDDAGRAPKVLAVTDFFPWPPRNGGLLRTSIAVEALAGVADVDLFSLYDRREPDRVVPETVRLQGFGAAPYPDIDASDRWRLIWLLRGGRDAVPMEVAMRRGDPGPRRGFEAWLADPAAPARRYDLVWFSRATIFDWLGRPDLGPTVVDFHDLESDKERRRAALSGGADLSLRSRLRAVLAREQARLNAHRWSAFERSVAATVDRVLLASAGEARRSPLPHLAVLPNTFRRPARPAGKSEPEQPSTLLFQGTFDYGPNVDGAQWLVDEIGPRIRARLPGATIRLVGKTTPAMDRLDRRPASVVVGLVPEMEPELSRADVAVVPVRYASGTRLKILESFANRVPVVSTTVGAEGLGAHDGVHLLIADGPEEFAVACARLVEDLEVRHRLLDAAEQLFLERYESRVAGEQIAALVAELADARR